MTFVDSKDMNNLMSVHQVLLEMLQWFHKQCLENSLNYYVVGGTMLGTIRHKGFIPWDDDIDVAMPRKDYEQFIKLYSSTTNTKYLVEEPNDNNTDFIYLFAKLYDTDTTLTESTRSKIKRGVYIDIFPLDGIGDTLEEAKYNFSKVFKYIRLHDMIVCAYRKDRAWYKNVSIFFGHILSPLLLSERKLNYYIQKLCKTKDFYQSNYVANLVGNWGYKEIVKKEYLGTPTIYKFENIEIYGVENPHEYLSAIYGDYMTPPPVEKQKSHHDFLELNLNKSYKE